MAMLNLRRRFLEQVERIRDLSKKYRYVYNQIIDYREKIDLNKQNVWIHGTGK